MARLRQHHQQKQQQQNAESEMNVDMIDVILERAPMCRCIQIRLFHYLENHIRRRKGDKQGKKRAKLSGFNKRVDAKII